MGKTFCALLAALMTTVVCALAVPALAAASTNSVYLTETGSNSAFTPGVSAFSVAGNGTTSPLGLSPFDVGDLGAGPSAIAVTPNARFAYAIGGSFVGTQLQPYSVASDGSLVAGTSQQINCLNTNGACISGGSATLGTGIAITPDGKHAFVTFGHSEFFCFPFGIARTGRTSRHAHSAQFPFPCFDARTARARAALRHARHGRARAAVSTSTADNLLARFDIGADGKITPAAFYSLSSVDGNGSPEGIAIAPDGRHAYVVYQPARFSCFIFCAKFGKAGHAAHPSTKAPPLEGVIQVNLDSAGNATVQPATSLYPGVASTAVAVTPDGRNLYVTSAASGTIEHLALAADGSLPAAVTHTTHTDGPLALAVTPDGSHVLATTQEPWSLSSFAISAADGHLTLGGSAGQPSTAYPVAVLPSGARAYTGVQDSSDNNDLLERNDLTAGLPTAISNLQTTSGGISMFGAVARPAQPTAAFTATPGKAGSVTKFDASASTDNVGKVARYDWKFGDGTTATSATPTIEHTYSTPSTYNVTLTVTDDSGCSATQVFTGQTAYCGGQPSAVTTASVVVVAPDQPPPGPIQSGAPTGQTTPPPSGPNTAPSTSGPPVISNFAVTQPCVSSAALTPVTPGAPAPKTEGVTFDLNEPATVTLTVMHRDGSPAWSDCPAGGRGGHGHQVVSYTPVGQQNSPGSTGHNGLTFATTSRRHRRRHGAGPMIVSATYGAGRHGASLAQALGDKRLAPGTYVVIVVAVDAAGQKSNNPNAKFWVTK